MTLVTLNMRSRSTKFNISFGFHKEVSVQMWLNSIQRFISRAQTNSLLKGVMVEGKQRIFSTFKHQQNETKHKKLTAQCFWTFIHIGDLHVL